GSVRRRRRSEFHRVVDFKDSLPGDIAGPLCASLNHLVHALGLLFELTPVVPDGTEPSDDRVGREFLAVNASDLGRPAFVVDAIDDDLGREGLVQGEDRTDVRIALVCPPYA